MKKFILALLCFVFSFAGSAGAVTLGKYAPGQLIPVAANDHSGLDTVVGILCEQNQEVYWTLFDHNSYPVIDGDFRCSENDFVGWSLNDHVNNLNGSDFYIVFAADKIERPDNDCKLNKGGPKIAANAFIVNTYEDDVTFVPSVPLEYSDFKSDVTLCLMGPKAIKSLSNGFSASCSYVAEPKSASTEGEATCSDPCSTGGASTSSTASARSSDCFCYVDARYWIDPAFGGQTSIITWSVDNLRVKNADNPICFVDDDKTTQCHVRVFDDDENWASVNIPFRGEVTVFDPCKIVGWPGFKEGFIRIPTSVLGDSFIAFSFVHSTYFKAQQTLLGNEGCKIYD